VEKSLFTDCLTKHLKGTRCEKWFVAVLVVVIILIAGVAGAYCFEDQVLARGEGATVTSSANDFASKMKDVSLSSPKSIVISEIKDAYSPFISKSL